MEVIIGKIITASTTATVATVRGGLGLPIERDLSFRAEKRLSAYAHDERLAGRVIV